MPEGMNPSFFMSDMILRLLVIHAFQAWVYAIVFAGVGYAAAAIWHRKAKR